VDEHEEHGDEQGAPSHGNAEGTNAAPSAVTSSAASTVLARDVLGQRELEPAFAMS
jgi:hypothetical protein